MNRIWPPESDDEPPAFDDGYGSKERPVNYRHFPGPMLVPYHETIVGVDQILQISIGGETKLERAAVDVALALIQTEAVVLTDLLKDARLQVALGKAAVGIASSVLRTDAHVETRKPGDPGR